MKYITALLRYITPNAPSASPGVKDIITRIEFMQLVSFTVLVIVITEFVK